MDGLLIGMGLGCALLAGLIAWAVAMRHGWIRALVVPLLALVALGVILWRASFLDFHQSIGIAAVAMVFVAPTLVGAFLGIVLATRRGR